jgi:hypothetical protein
MAKNERVRLILQKRDRAIPLRSVRPIFFGARSLFDETGVADSCAVLQGEIHPAAGIDFGAAFTAAVLVRIVHSSILNREGGKRQCGRESKRAGAEAESRCAVLT